MGTLVVVDAVREVRAEKRAAAGAPDSPRLVKAASITVRATVTTAPSLRTIGIMAPPTVAAVSRNVTLNDDLTPDCASV
jgi:hypothetical protein